MSKPRKSGSSGSADRSIARNPRARHDYHLLERYEAGLVLTGGEVKGLRAGRASLSESYAQMRGGELYLIGMNIPAYEHAASTEHEPTRTRKLLLSARDLHRNAGQLGEKGVTMVPLALYFRGGWAKVEVALAKGKSRYDKREALRKREHERTMARAKRRWR